MAKAKIQRDSVIFYRSFYEAVKELEPVQQAEVYNAVFEFALNGSEPKMSGIAKSIFTLIKPQILANNARYMNGKKGGRPQKEETEEEPSDEVDDRKAEPKSKQTETEEKPKQNLDLTETEAKETKAEPNENDNVNVNDNVNGNILTDVQEKNNCDCLNSACAREGVEKNIHEFIHTELGADFYRQSLTDSESFKDRIPAFDRYVDVLEHPFLDTDRDALFCIDMKAFAKIFASIWTNHLLKGKRIEDLSRYVWVAVRNFANEKRGT